MRTHVLLPGERKLEAGDKIQPGDLFVDDHEVRNPVPSTFINEDPTKVFNGLITFVRPAKK